MLFACLYAVNLTASVISALCWRVFSKFAGNAKANTIFLVRVLPPAVAAVLILALVLPSFILFEPSETDETITLKLGLVVGVAIFGFAMALVRIFLSWWSTKRLVNSWLRRGEEMQIDGIDMPAFKVDHPFPMIAVVGVLRPRVFIAGQILEGLSRDELMAAMAHEAGHMAARDNLKRIVMRICSDLLVFPFGKTLDRMWADATEREADQFAAARGQLSALDLASALIKVAKMMPLKTGPALPIGAFLLEPNHTLLASRIYHLIELADEPATSPDTPSPRRSLIPWLISAITLEAIPPLAFDRLILFRIYDLSERLFALLQ